MSETVPLESVSRWSGLSPWVVVLPWRMAGAASRNQVWGGLCGRPCAGQAPGIKSGAGSVVHRGTGPGPVRSRGEDLCDACGVGGRGIEARRGAGGGGSGPRAWCCLVERSARSSSRKKATTRGPSRALKRPVCPTGRQPLLALRQRRATLRSGPRASLRQGPQTPQAAPRDGLARLPAHPQDRRDLKRPVAPGDQGGGPSRALAVDQRAPVAEAPPHQVRPLGVGPPSLPGLRPCRVRAGEYRQR